jgi:hypothetical protein
MIKIFAVFQLLFDVRPPEPFKFGVFGIGFAVAFGLFLSAIAIGFFLFFKKRFSTNIRLIISAILVLAGLGGALVIGAAATIYDKNAKPEYVAPPRRVPPPG